MQLRPVVNGAAFVGDGLPMFNMSTLDPKQPLLSNPAFGKGVAAALGTKQGVLLSGHGLVMTGRSIYNLVGTSYQLRQNARIQLQAMALRGKVTPSTTFRCRRNCQAKGTPMLVPVRRAGPRGPRGTTARSA